MLNLDHCEVVSFLLDIYIFGGISMDYCACESVFEIFCGEFFLILLPMILLIKSPAVSSLF